ncbi:MAG: HD-GYP domain-containing protein, partial [Spirochaetaceae bacterium]|nr:HD-GYP domain-containing protein [Spirochaetaceae bacterium]
MVKYKIRDIPENSYFTAPVSTDGGFSIASPEIPVDENFKKLLLKWEFRELFSAGEPKEGPPGDILPFLEKPDKGSPAADDDYEQIGQAVETYALLSEYTEKLMDRISSGFLNRQKRVFPVAGINYQTLADDMREFCQIILKERRFLLRIMQEKTSPGGETENRDADPSRFLSSREDYQVSHAVKSLILSVIIGDYLKFNEDQLTELGVAALLHESGMLCLPPEIYLTNKPLTREKRKTILKHPVLGFSILKSLNFPPAVQFAVLEHHERENGKGYPRQLNGTRINAYAKIIAVACSYEASTAVRPYKDAKDGYEGVIEILKNEGGRYNNTVVRALIRLLSIYPIGSYVILSDDREAQVIDVNPDEPSYPIVRIAGESGGATIQTSAVGPYITGLRSEE